MPTFSATIQFHTATLSGLFLGVSTSVASQAAAQTLLNNMKTFITGNGGTIDTVNASFNADAVALS